MQRTDYTGDVAIFWDYENCPAPTNASGYFLVNQIRTLAHSFGIIKIFKAYVEISEQLKAPARAELQSSGVSLTDCPHMGKKDVADKMMIVDMMSYAMDHPGHRTIMIISGDRDYAYVAAVLRLRKYHVVVVSTSGSGVSNSLAAQASVCFDWTTDILGKPSTPDNSASSALRSGKDGDQWRTSPLSKLPTPSPEPVRAALPGNIQPRRHTISRTDSNAKPMLDGCAHEASSFGPTPPTQPMFSSSASLSTLTVVPSPDRLQENQKCSRVLDQSPSPACAPSSVRLNNDVSDEVVYDVPRPVLEPTTPFPGSSSLPNDHVPQSRQDVIGANMNRPISVPASHTPYNDNEKMYPEPKGKNKLTGMPNEELTSSYNPHPSASPPQLASTYSLSSTPPTLRPASHSSTPQNIPSALSAVSLPLASPKTLPEEFLPLVRVLEVHRKGGRTQPTRSVIACEIVSLDKSAYSKAGVSKFAQYISLAENKKIISMGGTGPGAWISLRPEWYDSV